MFIRRKEFEELKSSGKLLEDRIEFLTKRLERVCELLKYKPEYIPDSYSVWRDSSPAQIDLGNGLIRKLTKKAAQPEKYEVEESTLCTSKLGGVSYGYYAPKFDEYKANLNSDIADSMRYAWGLGVKKHDEKVKNMKSFLVTKPRKKKKFKNNKNKEK